MIAPVIDQLATELAGRVRVVKLNVDDNPGTAARFDLRSIPTLLVLKDGREVDRLVGVQPKQEIVRRLERGPRVRAFARLLVSVTVVTLAIVLLPRPAGVDWDPKT